MSEQKKQALKHEWEKVSDFYPSPMSMGQAHACDRYLQSCAAYDEAQVNKVNKLDKPVGVAG